MGRPKQRFLQVVKVDLKMLELKEKDAMERERWKRIFSFNHH